MTERPIWQSMLMTVGHVAFLIGFVALFDWLFSTHTDKAGFVLILAMAALLRTYQWRVDSQS